MLAAIARRWAEAGFRFPNHTINLAPRLLIHDYGTSVHYHCSMVELTKILYIIQTFAVALAKACCILCKANRWIDHTAK